MNSLLIEVNRLSTPPQHLDALRAEFEAGGLTHGRLAMGDISAEPTMAYCLWHDSGEVPVSMLIDRQALQDEQNTRAAARTFLVKWRRRLGSLTSYPLAMPSS
jgi:hypothetical protein